MRRTDVTRSMRAPRRATLVLAAVGAAGTLLVSGCGAGQIAETAAKAPSVPGVNAEVDVEGGSYKIRNLGVGYRDPEGYPAGSNAPLEMVLFNDTDEPVTVTFSTDSARSIALAGATAVPTPPAATSTPSVGAGVEPTDQPTATRTPRPTGSVQPLPTASAEAPAGAAPRVEIPARSFVLLNRTGGQFVQLEGLNEELLPGQSVKLQFDFGGQRFSTEVPVMVPLSPAPVASPVVEGEGGDGHGG
jgi:hypothetical protein